MGPRLLGDDAATLRDGFSESSASSRWSGTGLKASGATQRDARECNPDARRLGTIKEAFNIFHSEYIGTFGYFVAVFQDPNLFAVAFTVLIAFRFEVPAPGTLSFPGTILSPPVLFPTNPVI